MWCIHEKKIRKKWVFLPAGIKEVNYVGGRITYFTNKQQTNTLPSLSLIIINKDTFKNFKQMAKKKPIVFKVIKNDNVFPMDNSTNANFVDGPPK